MAKCLEAFKQWCEVSNLPWEPLVASPEALAWALRGYGMHLFEVGLPRYLLVYSITACQDMYPSCRAYTTVAWQIDKKWQVYEPGQCRAVLPAMAIRASICIAAFWGWFSWLGCVLLGFSAMLHPSEISITDSKRFDFSKGRSLRFFGSVRSHQESQDVKVCQASAWSCWWLGNHFSAWGFVLQSAFGRPPFPWVDHNF